MKLEGGEKYRVRLVPANCHREEVVFEMVSALDHLSAITDEIFGKIQDRVRRQNQEVAALRSRITAAATKVSNFKTSPKLIHIVSPAKFPEEETKERPQQFPIIQLQSLGEERVIRDTSEFLSKIKSQRVLYDSPVKHMDELLQYYRVRDLNYSKASSLSQLGTKYEVGLGNPPEDLQFLDSYFLFNSHTNPYQNYVVTDGSSTTSIKGARNKLISVQTEVDSKKDEAKGKHAVTSQSNNGEEPDDFYYYPSSVQIPQIDLPEHLPSLPGLSETLEFHTPEVSPFQRSTTPTPIPSQYVPTARTSHSPPEQLQDEEKPAFSPPPPPPPLPPSIPQGGISNTVPEPSQAIPTTSTQVMSPPPPPPPPLPRTEEPTPAPAVNRPKPAGTVDLRSNLMAAIRDAGGKSKLKTAKKPGSVSASVPKKEPAGTGGDLLEDLKNSLAMRRRGISGANDTNKGTGIGDIMRKMASSIPVPVDDDSFDSHTGNMSDEDDWD